MTRSSASGRCLVDMAADLEGRVALVTGAARGIGLATANALARAGAHVIIHDRDAPEAHAAAEALTRSGCRATALVSDLGEPSASADMLKALKNDQRAPDILILCASVEVRETWDMVSDDALRLQSEVNLHATVRLIRAFLPAMVERGFGRIVAIGSVQETRPNADCLYYAATKAAQTSMILNLARTLRAPDITFNIVQPGAIATGRNQAILAKPGYSQIARDRIPLGRIGKPQDCVGAILLLCSDQGSYINGAELAVDGGARL